MTEPEMLRAGVGTVRGLAGLMTRLKVRLRRGTLDAALADGRDPWSHPELMMRATQLVSWDLRHTIATALEGLVTIAELRRPASPYLSVRHGVVAQHREELLRIAARLRDPSPVPVRVVAQMTVLLWDGSSPAYSGGRPADGLGAITSRCQHELSTG